jgi:hypothetical protein
VQQFLGFSALALRILQHLLLLELLYLKLIHRYRLPRALV